MPLDAIINLNYEFYLALSLFIMIVGIGGYFLYRELTRSEERYFSFESKENYDNLGAKLNIVIKLEALKGFRNGGKAKISDIEILSKKDDNPIKALKENNEFPTLIPLKGEAARSGKFINLFNPESKKEKEIELTQSLELGMDISTVEKGEPKPTNKYSFERKEVNVKGSWKNLFILGIVAIISLAFTAVSGLESFLNLL